MIKWLKNEEGSGLVLAMMTLLVLSVLGASLGTITISGHKMSNVNRDSSSAYYIAEAGANMAYEDMKNIVSEVYDPQSNKEAFFGSIEAKFNDEILNYPAFETQFGYRPEANIEISEPEDVGDTRIYTIESRSTIRNHSRTAQKDVTVNWIGTEDNGGGGTLPPLPSNTSLIAKNSVKLVDGATIHNDVYIDSTATYPFIIEGGARRRNGVTFYNSAINENQVFNLPEWYSYESDLVLDIINKKIPWNKYTEIANSFPQLDMHPSYPTTPQAPNKYLEDYIINDSGGHNSHKIVSNGNIYHNNYLAKEYPLDLTSDINIRNIVVGSDKNLIINTGNNNLSIFIDNVNVANGSITINGTGNVALYVKEKVDISQSDFNVNNLKSFKIQSNEINITGGNTNINTNQSINLTAKVSMKFDNVNFNMQTSDNMHIQSNNITFSNINATFSSSSQVNIYAQNKYALNNGILRFNGISDVNLHTNNMEHSNGELDTVNTGLFSMFVKDKMSFGSGAINKNGDSHNFLIYYESEEYFDFGSSISLHASLFFKQADIKIGSGVKTHGPIVTRGNKVTLSGGATSSPLILAPQSSVEVEAGAQFKGILITDNISLDGGTSIKYEDYDYNLFPFGGSIGRDLNIQPDINDIITAEPTKEP